MLFGIIGGVLAVTVLAVVLLIQATSPPDVSTQLYTLQARINTLTKVTSEQNKHLTQNELSSINSTLQATLKSTSTDIATYMESRKLKSSDKRASTAKKSEQTKYEALSKKLNDAYLTGTLDRSYANEMAYQLSMLKSMMQRIKSTAKSKNYNTLYDQALPSIDTLTDQLSKFQSTK